MRFLFAFVAVSLFAGVSAAQCDSGAAVQVRTIRTVPLSQPSIRTVRVLQAPPVVCEYTEVRQVQPVVQFVPVAAPPRRVTTTVGPLGRVRRVQIEE